MRATLARIFLLYIPLFLVVLLQAGALLMLYAGKISGKNDTMIDLGTQVPALRFGWPVIFVVAIVYHVSTRKKD